MVIRHFFFIEEFGDPTHGRPRLLQGSHALGQLGNGLSEDPYVDHKGHDGPHGHATALLQGQDSADDNNQDIGEVANENHKRHHNARDKLRLPDAVMELAIELGELVQRLRHRIIASHHIVARISFLDEAINGCQVDLLGLEETLGPHANKHNQDKAHEDRDYRHQR